MTDKISPSSLNAPGSLTTEASTIPLSVQENRLLLLSNQARDHIKVVVEHVLIHEQDTPMAKAVWTWIVTLGTLAWDVSGSAISLLAMREFRAGKILSRALVDYGVRLDITRISPIKRWKISLMHRTASVSSLDLVRACIRTSQTGLRFNNFLQATTPSYGARRVR